MVAHRRAGKTVAAVNDLIEKASYNTRDNPRYAYIAPLLKQAKDIAWQYLKDFSAPFNPKNRINESGLWIELSALPNSPRITIYGADNPDAFRGLYLDGAVLDEFGNMRSSVWKEVLLPALIDRRGWAVFMGTPNGPNHFRDMYYTALKDPSWFNLMLPVTSTGVIPAEDLAEMRKIMDPEQYAQEMLCSFEASVRGAIFARQMEEIIAATPSRIGNYPLDPNLPTDVFMDLGFHDDSTIGFVQRMYDGFLMGHAYAANMLPIGHYIEYILKFWHDRGLRPGQIWLPHDAKAKSLQTGKSIVDHFRLAHLRPRIVTRLDKLDQIAAGRSTFPQWYFNEPECQTLILALKSYHREYDEDKKVYTDQPEHDWSSHYADMFMQAAVVVQPRQKAAPPVPKPAYHTTPEGLKYGFALNDIWDLGPKSSGRIYG
jgi:Terminase-like family.